MAGNAAAFPARRPGGGHNVSEVNGPFDSVTMQGWVMQGCFSEERPAEVRQCNAARRKKAHGVKGRSNQQCKGIYVEMYLYIYINIVVAFLARL